MIVDIDEEIISKLMDKHIKYEESKTFLDGTDFCHFGRAIFNDIIIDIVKNKLEKDSNN